jgi:transcriptional regulator with XRE-family HTH domain
MNARGFATMLIAARKAKGLTQEAACELIGIGDISTLSKWENGSIVPSEQMILKIVQAYEENLIGYLYLQECTKIGNMLLPELPIQHDLGGMVLRFQKEYNDIIKIRNEMVEVACDGIVHDYEEDIWQQAVKEIRELMAACMPLVVKNFKQNKMPLQDGHLERAI